MSACIALFAVGVKRIGKRPIRSLANVYLYALILAANHAAAVVVAYMDDREAVGLLPWLVR